MNKLDLSKTLKDYKKGWVALSSDYKKVLYNADSFIDLMNKVEKNNQKDKVVLIPAAENYRGFIGANK